MKWHTGRLVQVVVAAALGGLCLLAQAAEKKELTYTKTYSKSIVKSSIPLEDVANHELVQEVLLQQSKFSSADFQPVEEWIHIETDQIDGSGPHKGYYVLIHAGGEQTWGTFEGMAKTVSKPDGSWSTTWEGTYRYLGGTGKYKNIQGSGTYKGRASPKEPMYEEGRETITY